MRERAWVAGIANEEREGGFSCETRGGRVLFASDQSLKAREGD